MQTTRDLAGHIRGLTVTKTFYDFLPERSISLSSLGGST